MTRLKRLRLITTLLAGGHLLMACAPPGGNSPSRLSSLESSVHAACGAERNDLNMIAKIAWCIAEKDNLWDPEHLFHKTLQIDNYSVADGIAWGVQATAGPFKAPNKNFPKGISSILYQRVEPKAASYPSPGHINLSFTLLPDQQCVSLNDLTQVFGPDYWYNEAPIVVPSQVSDTRLPSESSEIYGVIFRSPKLFRGDPSGRVIFNFENTKCARTLKIIRDLDLKTHSNKGNK